MVNLCPLRLKNLGYFIITNVERYYDEGELWDEIKSTNSGFTEKDQTKVARKKSCKTKQGSIRWMCSLSKHFQYHLFFIVNLIYYFFTIKLYLHILNLKNKPHFYSPYFSFMHKVFILRGLEFISNIKNRYHEL